MPEVTSIVVTATRPEAVSTVLLNRGPQGPPGTGLAAYYEVVTDAPYNADPTGVADSTEGIQAAIDAAILAGTGVVFPAGTYLLDTLHPSEADTHLMAEFATNPGSKIDLIGLGDATLLSERELCVILRLRGDSVGAMVEGLRFRNTFLGGVQTKAGLRLWGGGVGTALKNTVVRNCEFSGLSIGLQLNGTKGTLITGNRFLAPNGRDGGSSTNAAPNVFIRSDYNAARVEDVTITDNYFNGYTGTDITADAPETTCPMDGALMGSMDGCLVSGNTVLNFAYEGFIVSRFAPAITDKKRANVLTDNLIICTPPTNATNWPQTVTLGEGAMWPVATAGDNTIVKNNTIVDAASPILVYKGEGTVVKNNLVVTTQDFIPRSAISVEPTSNSAISGSTDSDRATNVTVTGNVIRNRYAGVYDEERADIQIIRCDDALVADNTVIYDDFLTDGTLTNFRAGLRLRDATGVRMKGNTVQGCDYFLKTDSGFTYTGCKIGDNCDETLSGLHDGTLPAAIDFTNRVATADLPDAAAYTSDARFIVTDSDTAAAGNFGSTFAGGGSNVVPVYSDGTAWRIG